MGAVTAGVFGRGLGSVRYTRATGWRVLLRLLCHWAARACRATIALHRGAWPGVASTGAGRSARSIWPAVPTFPPSGAWYP